MLGFHCKATNWASQATHEAICFWFSLDGGLHLWLALKQFGAWLGASAVCVKARPQAREPR